MCNGLASLSFNKSNAKKNSRGRSFVITMHFHGMGSIYKSEFRVSLHVLESPLHVVIIPWLASQWTNSYCKMFILSFFLLKDSPRAFFKASTARSFLWIGSQIVRIMVSKHYGHWFRISNWCSSFHILLSGFAFKGFCLNSITVAISKSSRYCMLLPFNPSTVIMTDTWKRRVKYLGNQS